jgi:hypothetical protein
MSANSNASTLSSAPYAGRGKLVLGFESSCDETGVALVRLQGTGVPRLLARPA